MYLSEFYRCRFSASHSLNNRRSTHTNPDTQGNQRSLLVAAFQLVEHGTQDHGAGRAERMTHGDSTAIHIDLVVRNIERLHVAQDDRGKGLVKLPEVDILLGHACLFQDL